MVLKSVYWYYFATIKIKNNRNKHNGLSFSLLRQEKKVTLLKVFFMWRINGDCEIIKQKSLTFLVTLNICDKFNVYICYIAVLAMAFPIFYYLPPPPLHRINNNKQRCDSLTIWLYSSYLY